MSPEHTTLLEPVLLLASVQRGLAPQPVWPARMVTKAHSSGRVCVWLGQAPTGKGNSCHTTH